MRPCRWPAATGTGIRLSQAVALARAMMRSGDYPGAAAGLRQAIAETERECGPDAVDLILPLNELGMVGKYSGGFDEADAAYRRALRIHRQHGLGDTAALAAILHNLGGLAHARGEPRAALPLAREGIAVRRALPDLDAVMLAHDEAALAAILVDLAEFAEARELLGSALARYERWGAHHAGDVATVLHNLGSLDFREGRVTDALGRLRRARAAKRAVFGRRHPELAITLYNLARCYQRLGRTGAARRNLRLAVTILAPVAAADHPTLVACERQLAATT